MPDHSDDSIDPADIYPLEEFLAEQQALDSLGSRIFRRLRQSWRVVHLGVKVVSESTSVEIMNVLINNLWLITLLKSLYILMQCFVEDFR
jgi:hypothetical protein